MFNFREWFIINEGREEKLLAAQLAGDALTALSTVIPQNDKNTDKLLLLAAYYYSQVKDKEQVKTDMTDYIGYVKNNRMPLIAVDLVSKKPPSPWDNYLRWTEVIHGQKAEDEHKKQSSFKPSDIDFQNEKPILTGSDGKIRVYESNNPQQCIILGKGQSFCISQPGNRMWQSYRDNQTSTFYFVYDDTRDDKLGIVVVDVTKNGIILTDKSNNTGETLDPYTGILTNDSKPYIRYLREKGIDVSKFVNIPKSPEEQEEDEKLGKAKDDLDWFIALSPDYKSKYIGRGHPLTDSQFDYLLDNKLNSLSTQYVKTGLRLNDYQLGKISKIRDFKDNYLHNRLIAVQNHGNLTKNEYSLLNKKQKEIYYDRIKDDSKLYQAIQFNDLDLVRYFEEKGMKIYKNSINDHFDYLFDNNFNSLLTQYFKNGFRLSDYQIDKIASNSDLKDNYLLNRIISDQKKYTDDLTKKEYSLFSPKHKEIYYEKMSDDMKLYKATKFGELDVVEYLVEKGAKINDQEVYNAMSSGNLDLVKYLVGKGARVDRMSVSGAVTTGNLGLVKYLAGKGSETTDDTDYYASKTGNLDLVKYLVDEKRAKISYNSVSGAVETGNLDLVKYLVEKGAKIDDHSVYYAVKTGNLSLVKYLIKNGAEIDDYDYATSYATKNGHQDIVDYLKSLKDKNRLLRRG